MAIFSVSVKGGIGVKNLIKKYAVMLNSLLFMICFLSGVDSSSDYYDYEDDGDDKRTNDKKDDKSPVEIAGIVIPYHKLCLLNPCRRLFTTSFNHQWINVKIPLSNFSREKILHCSNRNDDGILDETEIKYTGIDSRI